MIRHHYLFAVCFIIIFSISHFNAFPSGFREHLFQGDKLYKAGNFPGAEARYSAAVEKKEGFNSYFRRGVARYRQGNFSEALGDFEQAALYANKSKAQSSSLYNAGNSGFYLGESLSETDLFSAISSIKRSIANYERAIELNPENLSAAKNLEIARIKLKEMEEKLNDNSDEAGTEQTNEEEQGNEKEKGNSGQQGDMDDNNSQDPEGGNDPQQNTNKKTAEEEGSSVFGQETPEDILKEEIRQRELREIEGSVIIEQVERDW